MIAKKTKPGGIPAEPAPGRIRSSTHGIKELIARFPEVQLATLVSAVPTGEHWVQEIKFDGYRLLGFRWQQSVRLITRNGEGLDRKLPFALSCPFGIDRGQRSVGHGSGGPRRQREK